MKGNEAEDEEAKKAEKKQTPPGGAVGTVLITEGGINQEVSAYR